MPIWRSSELVPGRAGSPSRRSSARSTTSQLNTTRSAGLPPSLADGAVDAPESSPQPNGPTRVSQSASRRGGSARNSISSFSSWDALPSGNLSSGGAPALPGAAAWGAQGDPTEVARQQVQTQAQVLTPRQRAASAAAVPGAATYTVQYIGIANGELGILSQKQKLAPTKATGPSLTITAATNPVLAGRVAAFTRQRPTSAAARPYGAAAPVASPAAVTTHAGISTAASAPPPAVSPGLGLSPPSLTLSPASGSPADPPRSPAAAAVPPQPAFVSAAPGAVFTDPAPSSPSPATAPLTHSRPSSAHTSRLTQGASPPPATVEATLGSAVNTDTAEAGQGVQSSEAGNAPDASLQGESAADARPDIANIEGRPSTASVAASASAGPPSRLASANSRGPSLTQIVDDARGQVKVITECFYSRALHSRAAPHDRHTRRNRPPGPQVRDMEPLNAGLSNRFGHRAPSAGGFSGYKLTAGGSAGALAATAKEMSPGMRSGAATGVMGFGGGFGSGAASTGARRQRPNSAGAGREPSGAWPQSSGATARTGRGAGG